MNKLLYTPVEAAELLSISRSRLYELMAAGKIGSVKLGSLRRITHDELVAYITHLQVGSAP